MTTIASLLLATASLSGAAPESSAPATSTSALWSPPRPYAYESSIPSLEDPEPTGWKGSVTAGTTFTSGNSKTTALNVTADAEKKREKDKFSMGLYYNFAEQEDPDTGEESTTVDKAGIKGQYDHTIDEKSYWLLQSSAEQDDLADLDLRFTLGAGYGRQFKDTEKVKYAGEVGLSWFKEEFGASEDGDYVAARLASKLEWIIKEGWTFTQTVEAFPSIEDPDDFFAKLDNRLKVQLKDSLLAQLQWVLDYDNTPADGADELDNRVVFTLGWSF